MAIRDKAAMHRELMRLPDSHQIDNKPNQYASHDNDDFISSESDRQQLLIKYFNPLCLSYAFRFYLAEFCHHLLIF